MSFVLHESKYLSEWFDKGSSIKLILKDIASEHISFTLGDSGAIFQRTGTVTMYTKEILDSKLKEYQGSVDEVIDKLVGSYKYIEVQLWSDDYVQEVIKKAKSFS